MELIKKHVDTVIVLAGILTSVLWINHQFTKLHDDIIVIKTVLIMQKIMPAELAVAGKDK